MAETTGIEWADATANFWIGCTKLSPACANCYAEAEWDLRKHRAEWGPHGDRSPVKAGAIVVRKMHRYLWEQLNGPVPDGHCLKSIDGDRSNTDPSNWMLIPRSILPRLAGRWGLPYDQAPAELKPAVLATAQLKHQAKNRRAGDHAK